MINKKSQKHLKGDRYGFRCNPYYFQNRRATPLQVSGVITIISELEKSEYAKALYILMNDITSTLILDIDYGTFISRIKFCRMVRHKKNDLYEITDKWNSEFEIRYWSNDDENKKNEMFPLTDEDVMWEVIQHVSDALNRAKEDSRITIFLSLFHFSDGHKTGDIMNKEEFEKLGCIQSTCFMIDGLGNTSYKTGILPGIARFQ